MDTIVGEAGRSRTGDGDWTLGTSTATSPTPAIRGRRVGREGWTGAPEGRGTAKLLGWFSVGLGVMQIVVQLFAIVMRRGMRGSGGESVNVAGSIFMGQTEGTLTSVRAVIDPESPISYELTKSLRELSGAARSLRLLAGYLERNPRSLIFGKPRVNED